MAENYTLYISNTEMIPNARIRHAAEGAKVRFFAEDEGHTEHANWVRFEVRWPDGVAKVNRRDRRDPEIAQRLVDFCSVIDETVHGKMDPHMWLLHEKILKSRNVLEMS